MKAIKVKDCAGNIYYVKGNSMVNSSLVKISIGDKPFKGYVTSMFFENHSDLQTYLEKNPNKIPIGKGCMCSGLKMGNSGDNHVYTITKVN